MILERISDPREVIFYFSSASISNLPRLLLDTAEESLIGRKTLRRTNNISGILQCLKKRKKQKKRERNKETILRSNSKLSKDSDDPIQIKSWMIKWS